MSAFTEMKIEKMLLEQAAMGSDTDIYMDSKLLRKPGRYGNKEYSVGIVPRDDDAKD